MLCGKQCVIVRKTLATTQEDSHMGLTDRVKEIVESAIALENDGIRFYRDASNRDIHPLGKAMFLSFIEEEEKHIEKLEELFTDEALVVNRPVDEALTAALDQLKSLFSGRYDEGEVVDCPNVDDLEAIQTAIDFEKDGGAVYRNAASIAVTQAEKDIFTLLAGEEDAHLSILENMHREMELAYKQEARAEQSTQMDWTKKLFMRPDAEARKMV